MKDLLYVLALAVSITGNANWAQASHGEDYLAMRLPRGTVVTICGAGGCWHRARVNDYGPVRATGDIADIAVGHWESVCGLPRSRGECRVTVKVIGAQPTLPPTDVE